MDFELYVQVRGPALLRAAFLLTGTHPAAEDLTQSVLEDALRHWRRVSRADHPDRYVQRMMLNRFLQQRRRRAGNEELLAEPDERGAGPDEGARVIDRDRLERLLAALPPRARAVLVLRFYLDLDERAVADLLGIAPGTVRSTVSRSLRVLRRAESESTGGPR